LTNILLIFDLLNSNGDYLNQTISSKILFLVFS
jgi:hypothetical protein